MYVLCRKTDLRIMNLQSLKQANSRYLLQTGFLLLSQLFAVALADDTYVGSSSCAGCHSEQYQQWQDSHHYQAMQLASPASVAGDFDNRVFKHFDVESRFFVRDGKYFVHTQGEDGQYGEYQIDYTFGVEPLQQYLVKFSNGRYQALTIAWDNRPEEGGGQRWFHLYPQQADQPDGLLHWTGSYFNWNLRCAECHSTGLQKNYSLETNGYKTQWQEINVACEACHGPGAGHLDWNDSGRSMDVAHKGFKADISRSGSWQFTKQNTAALSGRVEDRQLDVCAGCHARRSILGVPDIGDEFDQSHRLSLLTPELYYPDGQIRDEVYVYGSFLQSKMHSQGVVCSDCHNPHSGVVYDQGNGLCTSCHKAEVFDRSEHHQHKVGSTGAACKNCHMPETTYMVVDPRRDHSLRIPDPKISLDFGTPNACTQCHSDKTGEWAVSHLSPQSGSSVGHPYVEAFDKAGRAAVGADRDLASVALDKALPAIVRATAAELLRGYSGQLTLTVAAQLIYDEYPLVRRAAVGLMELVPPLQRFQLLSPLITDSHLSVRVEVARLLASVPVENLSQDQAKLSESALKIVIDSGALTLDAPETHANLARIYSDRGQYHNAEKAYLQALVIEPKFLPALLNLADLYRAKGEDWKSRPALERALAVEPEFADAHYAMGLLLVRQKRYSQALEYFQEAVKLSPDNSRFQYVYSVALADQGQDKLAIESLRRALLHRPENVQLLVALAGRLLQAKNRSGAEKIYHRLLKLAPNNRQVQQLGRVFPKG